MPAAAAAACNAAAQQMLSKHSQALIYRRPCSLPVMLLYLSSQSADMASERARGAWGVPSACHVASRSACVSNMAFTCWPVNSDASVLCVSKRSHICFPFSTCNVYFFFLISLQNEQSISPITDGGYVDHHNLMNLIPLSILDFQLNCINALLLA